MLPFTEETSGGSVYIRTFASTVEESELKWHWDEEDRWIEPLEETDWLFQFDNELPQKIDRRIFIQSGKIHRVIKGTGSLKVKITKL